MKIESYDIQMNSTSSFVQTHERYEQSTFFTQQRNEVQNSKEALKSSLFVTTSASQKVVYNEEDNLSFEDKVKKRIIELLLERISNKKNKIKLYPNDEIKLEKQNHNNPYKSNMPSNSWGFVYESSEEYYQKSSISFSTTASIKTASGEININLDLSFTQEFYEQHKERIQIGSANFEDPLIMNLENTNGSFNSINSNYSFEFDINSDGTKEQISQLNEGFGFLALDKNSNGQIDNGSELFGATTGDGFKELSVYDEDGNNWIDENDSIFNDLKIWEKSSNGESSLISISQAGIGAIYLGSIETNFDYYKSIGNQEARLNESSFFLKENGEAGIISSIDFAV